MTTLQVLLMLLAQPAAPERVHVDWVLPDGCPEPAALAATLRETLPKDRTFSASVRIDEPRTAEARWRAVVVSKGLDGQTRTRAVDAPDCARVTEAAVLVLTLAATALPAEAADVGRPAVLPPPAEPDAGAPAPEAPPVAEDEAARRPPTTLRLNLRVQALAGSTVGVVPGPGLSAGVGLAFALGPMRLELALFSWLEGETTEPGRGVRFGVTSLRGRACWLPTVKDDWFVGPCAGAEVAFIRATGRGVSLPLAVDTQAVTALAGATGGRQLSSLFRVFASLEVGLNALRPLFYVDTPVGTVEVHRIGLPAGRLTVGLELHLP